MSNAILKCHPLITSITINGIVKVPDGNNLITVASADVATMFKGSTTGLPAGQYPISFSSGPQDPTT